MQKIHDPACFDRNLKTSPLVLICLLADDVYRYLNFDEMGHCTAAAGSAFPVEVE